MKKRTSHEILKALPIDVEALYEKADESLPHSAKNWWWCWGGIVGFLFLLQVICGLLLAFWYKAEPHVAYSTIEQITLHTRFGSFVRSIHHWGATFMVLALFVHMLRVFVTGAYRDYRWGSWMFGVLLLVCTFGLAFTGYSLVSDQLSFWGITVTSNILSEVPLVGPTLKRFFLAGDGYNSSTLSRMYALHVQILPVALVLFSVGHLFFVRLFGMYLPGNQRDRDREAALQKEKGAYHFYPDHLLSELAIILYLFLVICLLAIAFPAPLGPQADPLVTPEHIKPEWYFYPFFHMLKLVPGKVGVGIMTLVGLGLFFWPVLDQYVFQKIDKAFKGKLEFGIVLGLAISCVYLFWAIAEVG